MVVACAIGWLLARGIVATIGRLVSRTATSWDDVVLERLAAPLSAACAIGVFAEQRLTSFLRSKQKAARRLAPAFAPRNGAGLFVRNSVMKLFRLPFVARLAMGNSLRDAIELPAPPAAV